LCIKRNKNIVQFIHSQVINICLKWVYNRFVSQFVIKNNKDMIYIELKMA